MILGNFISLRAFTVYMENLLRFEIYTEVSFTPPKVMWMLIMKLGHTEVKFYPEVKSQTGLSSLRVSCKCAHNRETDQQYIFKNKNFGHLFPVGHMLIV